MAILICGGAGYVGSHMVAALIEGGRDVVVIDNLSLGHKAAVNKAAAFYQGDLRDSSLLDKVFTEHKISSVVNYAACTLVSESVTNPIKYYENNVGGAMVLLSAMVRHNVMNIVFSSTAAVYGEPLTMPITEDMPTKPINPYGESKLAVEKMLSWYGAAYGLSYMALRYFNVAGAHEGGDIGECHEPESHIIPIVLQVALGKRDVMPLFGDDYDTADGTCIRDYIHVTDLADAHIKAVDKLAAGGESVIYNLGNGAGFSNMQIIEAARRITGVDIPIERRPRRAGDPPVLIASSDKIKNELGWIPKHTGLDSIISSAWKWHKANPEGFANG